MLDVFDHCKQLLSNENAVQSPQQKHTSWSQFSLGVNIFQVGFSQFQASLRRLLWSAGEEKVATTPLTPASATGGVRKIVSVAGWPLDPEATGVGISPAIVSLTHSEVTLASFLFLRHPKLIPTSWPLECSAPRWSHDWLLLVTWISAQTASSQGGLPCSPI